jgi:hypothetical protein
MRGSTCHTELYCATQSTFSASTRTRSSQLQLATSQRSCSRLLSPAAKLPQPTPSCHRVESALELRSWRVSWSLQPVNLISLPPPAHCSRYNGTTRLQGYAAGAWGRSHHPSCTLRPFYHWGQLASLRHSVERAVRFGEGGAARFGLEG